MYDERLCWEVGCEGMIRSYVGRIICEGKMGEYDGRVL